jgi:hypothetical protein
MTPTADLPDPDVLLAGTLALMSAWAAPCPRSGMSGPQWQHMLARKVSANLFFLMHHPQVRAPLAAVVRRLHAQWSAQAGGEAAAPAPQRPAEATLH